MRVIPRQSFKEACQEADKSIRMQHSLTMKDDVRLRDVFTYFLANGADTAILQRAFYDKLGMGLEGEGSEGYVLFVMGLEGEGSEGAYCLLFFEMAKQLAYSCGFMTIASASLASFISCFGSCFRIIDTISYSTMD